MNTLAKIHELAQTNGIHNIMLFGSTGRGTAGPDSDIDLLVSIGTPDLMKVSHFQNALQELLGYKVDVVPRGSLKQHVADTISPDEVLSL